MSTIDCTIRNARHDDAPALSVLSAELGYPVPIEVLAERIFRLDPSQHAVFVAELDGRVVGSIDVGLVFHVQSGMRAEIGGLVVAPTERSHGIGRRLMLRVEEWAREKKMAELLVRSNNVREDAHRFYLRENYVQTKLQAVFVKKL